MTIDRSTFTRPAFALLLGLMLAWSTAPAQAQQPRKDRPGRGMGPDMMNEQRHQQMMENPIHRMQMMTFLLPAMADTLEYTEAQREQMSTLKKQALEHHAEHRQAMIDQREELLNLFAEDQNPSATVVERYMTSMGEHRAQQQSLLYGTGEQMLNALTSEQREMYQNMSPREMMTQMRAHLSMDDRMQMMQTLHSPANLFMRGRSGEMGPGQMQNNGRRPDRMGAPDNGRGQNNDRRQKRMGPPDTTDTGPPNKR